MRIAREHLLLALFVLPLSLYLYAYSRTPLLPRIDPPYYAGQLIWIAKYGTLRHPDPPLTFYLLLPFYWLTGDCIAAVKVGTSFLISLAYIPAYLFIKEVEGDEISAAIGALSFSFSEYIVRMVTDFIKNGVGVIWVFSWLLFAYKYHKSSRKIYLIGAILSTVLAMFTHILDFGFIIALSLLNMLIRRLDRKSIYLASISVILLFVAFLQPWIVGGDVFKGIAFAEEVAEGETKVRPYRLVDFLPYSVSIFLILTWFLGGNSLYLALGILALLMNMPLYGGEWLMRFVNMTCIPLAVAVGHGISKLGKKGLLISLLLVTMIGSSGFEMATSSRSTIDLQTYNEMKNILTTLDGKFFIPDVRLRYWAETISLDVTSNPCEADLILECTLPGSRSARAIPFIPPNVKPVIEGGSCKVFRIKAKP